MKAMIFAAGLGTRLKPLTDTMPKAMVPIGGKPLLEHVSRKLLDNGFDDITVNVHHFAEQIIDYVSAQYGIEECPGKGFHISDERDLLRETGGAVAHAVKYLSGSDFLVHNVDILSNLDFSAFVSAVRPDALATLVMSDRQSSRYLLFDDDMRLVGWTNTKTNEVRTVFAEPDPDKLLQSSRKLAFSGIHIMSGTILNLMESWGERFSIIDFYLSVARDYPVYGYVQPGFRMIDVGKLDSLAQAELFLDRNLPAASL